MRCHPLKLENSGKAVSLEVGGLQGVSCINRELQVCVWGLSMLGPLREGPGSGLRLPEQTVLGMGHLAAHPFLHYCFVPFLSILLLPRDLNFRIKYCVLSFIPTVSIWLL